MSYLDFYSQDIEQLYMYIYILVVTAVAEEQRRPGTGPISCLLLCPPPKKILFPLTFSARGVSYLFDIQAKTFNPVYDGEDLIAQARTGTGKTFSFAIPLVEKLQKNMTEYTRGRSPKVHTHTNTHTHTKTFTQITEEKHQSHYQLLSVYVCIWLSRLSVCL